MDIVLDVMGWSAAYHDLIMTLDLSNRKYIKNPSSISKHVLWLP